MYKLIEVKTDDKEQAKFLYELLLDRNYSISHDFQTDYENHLEFLKSNPYRVWYIVESSSTPLGSIYLTYDNSIGITLKNENWKVYMDLIDLIKKLHQPLSGVKSVRNNSFIISVNPNNKELLKAISELKLQHISNTYTLN